MGNDYVIHSRKMFLHGTFGKSLQQSTNTKRNWIRKVPMIFVEILGKCLLLKIDKGELLVQLTKPAQNEIKSILHSILIKVLFTSINQIF